MDSNARGGEAIENSLLYRNLKPSSLEPSRSGAPQSSHIDR